MNQRRLLKSRDGRNEEVTSASWVNKLLVGLDDLLGNSGAISSWNIRHEDSCGVILLLLTFMKVLVEEISKFNFRTDDQVNASSDSGSAVAVCPGALEELETVDDASLVCNKEKTSVFLVVFVVSIKAS